MTERSRAQTWEITDHFCSEGELPLKGREVGEEPVILKEDVQVNAVGDSEPCVRAEKRTHTFRAASYPYQCSRPTDTAVVGGEKRESSHISTDDADAQWYATGIMEVSLTQRCCSHPVRRKIAFDGQHASWDIPLSLIVLFQP